MAPFDLTAFGPRAVFVWAPLAGRSKRSAILPREIEKRHDSGRDRKTVRRLGSFRTRFYELSSHLLAFRGNRQ
jgi:hypothetical protein